MYVPVQSFFLRNNIARNVFNLPFFFPQMIVQVTIESRNLPSDWSNLSALWLVEIVSPESPSPMCITTTQAQRMHNTLGSHFTMQ